MAFLKDTYNQENQNDPDSHFRYSVYWLVKKQASPILSILHIGHLK